MQVSRRKFLGIGYSREAFRAEAISTFNAQIGERFGLKF